MGFLNKELELAGQKPFTTYVDGVVDTLVMAKQMYPGKRNSLDALCDRLGVDNSTRTLHGALLDAELLADVYINLTRGQEALLIDAGGDEGKKGSEEPVDLTGFVLPIIQANAQEHAAHEEQLTQLDKASAGNTIWRQVASV